MVPVLIVRNTHRDYGLIVNTIIGQREIVLKSLGDFFAESSNYFSGATILGDGRVVPHFKPRRFIIGMKESSPHIQLGSFLANRYESNNGYIVTFYTNEFAKIRVYII